MNYKMLVCAVLAAAFPAMPAMAQVNNHATAVPVLCNVDGSAVDQGFFSEFVNIQNGLYWTGGANPPENTYIESETGLRVDVPGYPARTVTLQYQLGAVNGGSQSHRCSDCAYVSIVLSDGTYINQFLTSGAHLEKGFSISNAGHNFSTLTWNAALAGKTNKNICRVYFTDYGPNDYENESFQDFVTRVYVDGVLAIPLVHDGFEYDCSDD